MDKIAFILCDPTPVKQHSTLPLNKKTGQELVWLAQLGFRAESLGENTPWF